MFSSFLRNEIRDKSIYYIFSVIVCQLNRRISNNWQRRLWSTLSFIFKSSHLVNELCWQSKSKVYAFRKISCRISVTYRRDGSKWRWRSFKLMPLLLGLVSASLKSLQLLFFSFLLSRRVCTNLCQNQLFSFNSIHILKFNFYLIFKMLKVEIFQKFSSRNKSNLNYAKPLTAAICWSGSERSTVWSPVCLRLHNRVENVFYYVIVNSARLLNYWGQE